MIDVFTREEFEAALPKNVAGEPLWKSIGLQGGEFCYTLPVSEYCSVMIRSTVGPQGVSAECGEDSIRCWLIDAENFPIGSKLTRWITRVAGWEERLTEMLRRMYKLGKFVVPCTCGGTHTVRKVKKTGPNEGKLFVGCTGRDCKYFKWVEETESVVRLA